MVFTNKYSEILINNISGFRHYIEETCKDGDESEVSICTLFDMLTDYYVRNIISKGNVISNEERTIFELIESHLLKFENYIEGTDENDFCNEACVSFLENLQNFASSNAIRYERFIPLLGARSRAFCKEWDKFTGVRSPGLWTDQEWDEANKQN